MINAIKTAINIAALLVSLYAIKCVKMMTPNAQRPNVPVGMPLRILQMVQYLINVNKLIGNIKKIHK